MNIGKRVTVTKAANPTLTNITGTIIDETKHTITIRTQDKDKTIIKTHIITLEEKP